MKKFMLPLMVAVLAAGFQLTSTNGNLSPASASTKQTVVDIGTFVYQGVNYEAYGTASNHHVSYVIDNVNHVQIAANGTYTAPVGDQGTISTEFTAHNGTSVFYSGHYFV